jgi:hypothetical protein
MESGMHLGHFTPKVKEFVPSRKEYANWQFVIPFGVGMKYSIDKSSSIGLEYGLRKTFTDYMDDVSTSYVYTKVGEARGAYSPALLAQWDDVSSRFGRPFTEILFLAKGIIFLAHVQLAQDNKEEIHLILDSYMFMMITYQRKIRTTRKGLPKF